MAKKRGKDISKNVKVFRHEFKTHVITAITAAFAFIIALTWRDAIQSWIGIFIKKIALEKTWYFDLLVASVITLICVLGILIVSKLGEK